MLGGDLPVSRLGFGAMRITGKGIWGPPADRAEAVAVLRRAVDLGVNLIHSVEAYGPHVSEELIREALHPYPAGLVIATKGGFDRPGPDQWEVNGRPERLREGVEGSLRRLGLERIDLYQLHRIDPDVPADEQFGALLQFQREGKIRHIGLSATTVEQIEAARRHFPVASVQNRYNLGDREWESVVDHCDREGIGFIPWYPLAVGKLAEDGGPLAEIAARHGRARRRSRSPGCCGARRSCFPSPARPRRSTWWKNVAGAGIDLSDEEYASLAS